METNYWLSWTSIFEFMLWRLLQMYRCICTPNIKMTKSHPVAQKDLLDQFPGVSKRLMHHGSKVSKTDALGKNSLAPLALLHSISLHPAPFCYTPLRSWAHLLIRKRQCTDKMRSTCSHLRDSNHSAMVC